MILLSGQPARLPKLPEGWKFIFHPTDYLRAEDPQGQDYFISPHRAYPVAHYNDGLRGIDTANAIPLGEGK